MGVGDFTYQVLEGVKIVGANVDDESGRHDQLWRCMAERRRGGAQPVFNRWRYRARWSGKDSCKFWHADLSHTEATAFEYLADDVNRGSTRPTDRSKKGQQLIGLRSGTRDLIR